jgi:ATP-dependent DNA helicase RecQ
MSIDLISRYPETLRLLKKHWGFDDFRPGQDIAVKSVLSGSNTLVLFPTGGGKSLCYQVPALVLDGLTLVISPLVALMEDQVNQLRNAGISAEFINSTLTKHQVEQRVINARNGMYRLLYVAPERLQTPLFQYELPDMNVDLVAVDEAHCISEWGHEFRPSYRLIRSWIEQSGIQPRWMALTATATPKVKEDIITNLGFHDPVVVSKTFERSNLRWWVIPTHQKMAMLKKLLAKSEGSGLIYAGTRRECQQLAEQVTKLGVRAEAYHAGLPADLRRKIQGDWISGSIPIVVATNAFGMGIDKANCRFVIHWAIPGSIEAYYQEAGRAGRDGLPSFPVLLYSENDVERLRNQTEQSHPNREVLHKVYSGLCDTLDLALGTMHDHPRVIDPVALSKRTGVPLKMIPYTLQALDRYNVITLNEEYPQAIGIRFKVDAEFVCRPTQGKKPAKDAFGDTLVRLYGAEASYDYYYLDTQLVCEKLQLSTNALIKALEVFRLDGFLDYEIRDGKPLVQLVEPRHMRVPVSKETVEHYRRQLMLRLDYIQGYAESKQCRSAYLRRYFGETNVPDRCDNCDICLKDLKANARYDLETDARELLKRIIEKDQEFDSLRKQLQWDPKRMRQSVSWLMHEGYIRQQGTLLSSARN